MRVKHKFLSMLLAVCMIFGMNSFAVFAAENPVSIWDGSSVATAYENGDGTEANPYEIATAEQFAYFAKQIGEGIGTNAYYILTNDLDMTAASWEPIGYLFDDYNYGNYFYGSFDGQGNCITYQISTISDVSGYSAVGLFGFVEGEISNLTVDGSISGISFIEGSWLGGICGLFAGNMTNCKSDVDISISDGTTNSNYIGGIAGETQDGTIKNCHYTGEIDLTFISGMGELFVGGITGTTYAGMIDSCKNEGNISVQGMQLGYIGGISGRIYTGGAPVTSEIRSCYSSGNISASNIAGGVVGEVSATLFDASGSAISSVNNSFSSGNVVGNIKSGAIAGELSEITNVEEITKAIVEDCYYTVGNDDNATLLTDKDELYKKLCEMSEEGMWLQDANGNPRLYWEFTVNPTPQAAFTATSDNGGTLSGVDASMKYSIDGGNNWNDIAGETIDLTGVTAANDVKVYQPGDRLYTLDSEIQTIDVTQADKPTVSHVDCTTKEQNDGQITGVDNTMEYKLSTVSEWTKITENAVTGLKNGIYDVRVKANGTVLASTAVTVTISEHTCVAQEGWYSDKTNHWNTCECSEVINKAAHTFKWVVDKEATATVAGAKHEECTVCGYKKAAVEIPATGTTDPVDPPKPTDPTNPPKPTDSDKENSNKGTNSVETGDNSNVVLWICLLLVSGGAVTGTVLYNRRKRKS